MLDWAKIPHDWGTAWDSRQKSIGKDCDAGRDWGQEEKGTTEGETAGWYH